MQMATRARLNGCLLLVSCSLVQLSLSRFVFVFQLHAVTTNGDCSGFFEGAQSPECDTYLNRFCLREAGSSRSNTDDSDCPLGSNNTRFGPDGTLPTSRVTFSELSWPVSFQIFNSCVPYVIPMTA